jgi:hypothetical protein
MKILNAVIGLGVLVATLASGWSAMTLSQVNTALSSLDARVGRIEGLLMKR